MNDPYQGYPSQQNKDGYPPQPYPPQGYPSHPYQPQEYPPNVGFVNPGYPGNQPQPSGFVPLVPPANNPYGAPNIPPQHPGAYVDPEDLHEIKGFDFSEETIRRGFIRKVYSILSLQLLVTLAFIFLVTYEHNTRLLVSRNMFLLIVALIVVFGALIAMVCVESVRRKSPHNMIALTIFTLGESYLVGASTMKFAPEDILLAIGITAAVCIALTIFAFQTKWDFTMLGGILFVALTILILFGLIGFFWPGRTMQLIYSSCGAVLFAIYLIYDTQMMMGGKHKYSISPEEYIFGALALYLDIINIFIHILSIIGSSKN
ncbi:Protein lifeguard 1 [Pseudolycoriella hygida]|uniref:Protein lifeguard 1 n=1 Tax=Pseudolycoriella hygida TaxID=35572 RepID=A0A9Q0S2J4_9DIPT|nr:Protein lifeguard 1 [Pseudolycoriella hygida]